MRSPPSELFTKNESSLNNTPTLQPDRYILNNISKELHTNNNINQMVIILNRCGGVDYLH